jgi:transcription factor IIIB 90 kDa subunit
MTCSNSACPNPDIVEDNGTQVCATCGVVARESNIVSELTFGETSSGAAAVQGSYVGEGRTHGQSSGAPHPGIHDGLTSREVTTLNARREIDALILNLRIPANLADPAVNIFKLSLAHAIYDSDGNREKGKKNFVQGRSIRTVAAVALYVACRRQKNTNTIMLIDLAETMTPQVSVFKMGNIYNRLVRAIWGTADGSVSREGYVDPINPENLIRRFARELEFGSLVGKVTEDAIRLVQRMDRDWMTTGRRPAGICGAALILAARMNNFRRTVREVVLIVKVCEVTVNNRLEEFQHTDSSNLTVQQLRHGDHTAPCDPPAFYRAKGEGKQPKKRGRKRKNQAAETAAEIENGDEEEEEPPRKRGRIDNDGFAIPDIPIDPALRNAASQEYPSDEAIAAALTSAVNTAASEMEQSQGSNADGSSYSSQTTEPPRRQGRPKGSKNKHAPDATHAEIALEAEIEHEILDTMNSDAMQRATPSGTPTTSTRSTPALEPSSNSDQPSLPRPQLGTTIDTSDQPPGPNSNATIVPQQEALSQLQVAQKKPNEISMDPEILPDEFDDDPEIANIILSEQEVMIKEHIWVEENKQWLRDEHAKRIKKQLQDAADIAAGLVPGESNKKKRRKGRRLGDVSYLKDNEQGGSEIGDLEGGGEGDEAGRARRAASIAMKGMLEQRGYSRRLNYDALSKMFPDDMASVREDSVESRRTIGKRRDTRKSRERSVSASNATTAASPISPSSAASKPASPSPRSRPVSATSATARPAQQTQLPTPSATQQQQQQQSQASPSPSPSPPTPSQPQQANQPPSQPHPAPTEGTEELIGVLSDPSDPSDSPLSSLQPTRAYNSPLIGTAQSGGFGGDEDEDDDEEDEEEEEESEGDPDDYIQDGIEKALSGRYRFSFGEEEDDGVE